MVLRDYLPQAFTKDVRINLRSGDIRVAQHHLKAAEIGAAF